MNNTTNNEVHLFCLPFSESIFLTDDLLYHLSFDEKTKAASFIFSKDRHQYIQTRGVLRIILSKYLGIPPKSVHIQVREDGKPFHYPIGKNSFYFNVSHTENHCAFVFSSCVDVGVDIENVKPFPSFVNFAYQFFSDEEFAYISAKDEQFQLQAFYECWTRREAFLKSIGIGIVNLEIWKKTSFMEDIITRHDQKTSWKIDTFWIDHKACCTVCYECTNSHFEIQKKGWESLCTT